MSTMQTVINTVFKNREKRKKYMLILLSLSIVVAIAVSIILITPADRSAYMRNGRPYARRGMLSAELCAGA